MILMGDRGAIEMVGKVGALGGLGLKKRKKPLQIIEIFH